MKKIVAVNCSPRKGWNTDLMVQAAAKGAREAGAEVQYFDLCRLEQFTGCVSCFGCKLPPNEGRCVCLDDMHPITEAINKSDGLIIGTPIYLSTISAGMHALVERLVFQNVTYQKELKTYRKRRIPVLMVVTSGMAEERYADTGYDRMLETWRGMLDRSIGPTSLVVSGDVMQVSDYGRFNWTAFDPESKIRGRKERFPKELEKAEAAGAALVRGEE